ncbi:hypothetical protein LTR28_012714 [Elasticomyces elasticus]|nr:hypothetical protein LTR28_012714 [Elasticomyces elasticus]
MYHGQCPAMQQVAVLLNMMEQAEQAEQALLDELTTSGPQATVTSQKLADEGISIGKQPVLVKQVGNTNEEPFEVGDSCRFIGTTFTHSVTDQPASDNEAGTTRQLATSAAAHAKNSYIVLQNDANDADSLSKARSCKHDKSTHKLDAHTGTAGNNKNVTGNRVNEGSPLQGRPSLSQGRQTPVPNVNRPEPAHGNGSTDPDQVYNTVEVTGEKQLQSKSRDENLAKRLGRKVLEHQRHLRRTTWREAEVILPIRDRTIGHDNVIQSTDPLSWPTISGARLSTTAGDHAYGLTFPSALLDRIDVSGCAIPYAA